MNLSVLFVAVAVMVAAAVRSTWSPCGLSMLSTITPIGERAKGHSYRSTAGWFVLGAVLGGATLGTTMALLAAAVHSVHAPATWLDLSALVATAIAAVSDSGIAGVRLPIHHRQVNERWLDQYRPWVYGSGFGWQIGTGLVTYITTAAVYLMVVLGALSAAPVVAFLLGALFGLLRGLAVLLTRKQTSPAALLAFHRRFAAAGVKVGRAVLVVEVGAAVTMAVTLTAVVSSASAGDALRAVLVVTGVVTGVVAVVALRRHRGQLRPDNPVDNEIVNAADNEVAPLQPLVGHSA